MKYWKYEIQTIVAVGKDEQGKPITHESFLTKYIPCTPENEEIAKNEAYNGKYDVEELPDPEPEVTTDDILNAMLGVT